MENIQQFEATVPEKYNRTIKDMTDYIVINAVKSFLIQDHNYDYLYHAVYKKYSFDANEAYNGILLYQYLTLFGDHTDLYYQRDPEKIKAYFENSFKLELARYSDRWQEKDVMDLDMNDYIAITQLKSKFI